VVNVLWGATRCSPALRPQRLWRPLSL
jgi:hypothetical protein